MSVELQVKEVCSHQELKRNRRRDFKLGHRLRGAARPRVASVHQRRRRAGPCACIARWACLLTSFSLYSMNLTTMASASDLMSSNLTLPDCASKNAPDKPQVSFCGSVACQRRRTVWSKHVLYRLRHARCALVDLRRAKDSDTRDKQAEHTKERTGNSTPSALTSVTISACADSMSPRVAVRHGRRAAHERELLPSAPEEHVMDQCDLRAAGQGRTAALLAAVASEMGQAVEESGLMCGQMTFSRCVRACASAAVHLRANFARSIEAWVRCALERSRRMSSEATVLQLASLALDSRSARSGRPWHQRWKEHRSQALGANNRQDDGAGAKQQAHAHKNRARRGDRQEQTANLEVTRARELELASCFPGIGTHPVERNHEKVSNENERARVKA